MVASQGGPREHLARFRAHRHEVAARRRLGRAREEGRSGRRRRAGRRRRRGGRPSAALARSARWCWCGAWSRRSSCRWSRAAASPTAPASPRCSRSAPMRCSSARASSPRPRRACTTTTSEAVLAADVHDTTLVGRGGLPIRQLKNAFSAKYEAAERAGASERGAAMLIYKTRSLKQAALEGDVEWGKVEAGQSAGLIDDILPAAELMRRLVRRSRGGETEAGVPMKRSADRRPRRGAHPDDEPPGEAQRAQHRADAGAARGAARGRRRRQRRRDRAHRRRAGLLRRRRPRRVQGPATDPRAAGERAELTMQLHLVFSQHDEAGRDRDQRRGDGRRRGPRDRRRPRGDGAEREARLSRGEARHRRRDRDGEPRAPGRPQGGLRAGRARRADRRRARAGSSAW